MTSGFGKFWGHLSARRKGVREQWYAPRWFATSYGWNGALFADSGAEMWVALPRYSNGFCSSQQLWQLGKVPARYPICADSHRPSKSLWHVPVVSGRRLAGQWESGMVTSKWSAEYSMCISEYTISTQSSMRLLLSVNIFGAFSYILTCRHVFCAFTSMFLVVRRTRFLSGPKID